MKNVCLPGLLSFAFLLPFVAIAQWKTVPVFQNEDLQITLRHLKKADLLTADWMELAFTNLGTQEICLTSARLKFCWPVVTAQKEAAWTGGDQSGCDLYDLFECFWESQIVSNGLDSLRIAPGETVTSRRGVSDYTSALLAKEFGRSQRIPLKLMLSLYYAVAGRPENLQLEDAVFDLRWEVLKSAQNDALVRRLDTSLDLIHQGAGNAGILRYLLSRPEIAGQLPPARYIAALEKSLTGNIKWPRWAVCTYLSQVNLAAEDRGKLRSFYIGKIQTFEALPWQQQFQIFEVDLTYFWDATLVDPLLECFERQPRYRFQILKLLDQHADDWADKPGYSARLFKVLWPMLEPTLQQQQNGCLEFFWTTSVLAQTRDSAAIAYLAPLLADTSRLCREHLAEGIPGMVTLKHFTKPYAPQRVCDIALSAIYHAQGRDILKIYRERIPMKSAVDPRNPQLRFEYFESWDPAIWGQLRDELITQLQAELNR